MSDDSMSIKELLIKNEVGLKKSLGQNFLIDANISNKIIKLSAIDKYSNVLEIGAGIGALTTLLSQAAKSVIAVELDSRLIPLLNDVLKPYDNVRVIQGDILKLDIKNIVKENFGDLPCSVCANLPYNITTPALTVLIEADVFDNITVMIQREVAQRICAKPGTSDYGAFTLYANYHTTPEILFDVSPECFIPKPKVYSSVINMKIKKDKKLLPEDEKLMFKVIRAAFGQRRKTLVNALYSVFRDSLDKAQIEGVIAKCGFDTRIRGEVLSLDDFMVLSENIKKVTF